MKMAWSTVVKLCLIVILCFTVVDYVNAQGRTAGSSNTNLKLKEEVEFLKANLSALWDIVSALQTRAAEERQDESEELVVSLGLKRRETWGPNMKNIFDSQIRVRPQDESKSYPAVSAAYLLFRRKDYSTWRRVKNTDELYFWHRGTTLLLHTLKPDGSVQQVKLGDPIQDPDASPQVIIAVGSWVAAELEDKLSYCLISVVQAPGFDASKAEVGQPEALISRYPQSETLINRLAPPRQLPATTADVVDDE
ncbi:hypothetical protein DAPPUDRAFT_230092 [Daphnia pulex]|uniref:DUF985 domain-containing protein n=1 Tax=Daphnia pulex TaxID=6669 RepID=E9FQW0_DAPPU|nr:hypothetical protein DAPPUDRAFT_230092 [Daphnia pulex]|eukprot:EFX90303.1 hypothetical protein DAPPUDRAFT_230092 [Daphnia pulex]